MRLVKYFILIIIIFLYSCKETNKEVAENKQYYNSEIDKAKNENQEWTKSPLSIVMKLSSSDLNCDETSIFVKKLNNGETLEKVEIIIKEKGQVGHESSSSGQVYILEKAGNTWKFE
jgi:hypothetical protein